MVRSVNVGSVRVAVAGNRTTPKTLTGAFTETKFRAYLLVVLVLQPWNHESRAKEVFHRLLSPGVTFSSRNRALVNLTRKSCCPESVATSCRSFNFQRSSLINTQIFDRGSSTSLHCSQRTDLLLMNARIQRTSRSLSVGETFISSRPRLRTTSVRTLFSPLVLSRIPGFLERAGRCPVIQVLIQGSIQEVNGVTAK